MISAYSCCAELKKAGQDYLDAIGTDREAVFGTTNRSKQSIPEKDMFFTEGVLMGKRRLPQIFTMLICIVFVVMNSATFVYADMGPKPEVHVVFKNMGDELCFGTLLSEKSHVPPGYRVWDGTDENAYYRDDEDGPIDDFANYTVWKAFVEYEDSDGFYFLQRAWRIDETREIIWGYYPPERFKILLYYPETRAFFVSGVCERYAFESYYTVDMNGIDIGQIESSGSDARQIEAYRSHALYAHMREISSFVSRVIITILIEIMVALFFGFRKRKQLLLVAGANMITQVILNVTLILSSSTLSFTFFVFLEVLVFLIEAVVYCTLLKKISECPRKNWYYVVYSLVANVISFGTGLGMILFL